MHTLFSSERVHPRDRYDLWHEVACKKIVGHASQPLDRQRFDASIEWASLADLSFIVVATGGLIVQRTQLHIAQAPDDALFVCQQIAGGCRLEQDGRQVTLAPADFTLLDPQRPYQAELDPGFRMLILKVPRRDLEARVGHMRELTARALRGEDHIGALASMHLAMLPQHVDVLARESAETSAAYTRDLIALSLARIGAAAPTRSAARALAASNLRAFVEARLEDPRLGPDVAAGGAGISVRYANSLLAEEGTSLRRLIQARRLERCAAALANPSHQHRTVSEIAFAWGFSNLTHFGRLFKQRFGLSPSEYRSAALSLAPGARTSP